MKRPRSPEVERMYRELQRVTQALPEARRNQLTRELTMTEKKEGRITRALKAAIKGSGKTPAALAWEAGLNPSQIYRFLEGGTLTLESVDALAELLGADLTLKSAATMKKPASTKPTPSDDEFTRELSRELNSAMRKIGSKR